MITINQKRYHRTGKGMSGYDMQAMLPKLKRQYPWLAEVNSQALQIVCHNLADAYGKFFKKQSGYPKFKKRGAHDSFTSINNSRVESSGVRLPKLGIMAFRGGDQPEGRIKRVTVFKDAGGFYASILVDTPQQEPPEHQSETILGIDVGLLDMVVTSFGEAVKAPKFFKASQAKLRQRQQTLSRKQKGSKRRLKAKQAVAVLHRKIRNQRKDFNHKLSRKLVNSESQAFAIEDLAVKNLMKNPKLAKHIADCGWRQFLTFLKYKSAAVGKPVIKVGRFFPSSKTCSTCGIVRESLPLSTRQWTCDSCGAMHNRDVNAAINIALEASRNGVFDRGDGGSPGVLRLAAVCETRRATAW